MSYDKKIIERFLNKNHMMYIHPYKLLSINDYTDNGNEYISVSAYISDDIKEFSTGIILSKYYLESYIRECRNDNIFKIIKLFYL